MIEEIELGKLVENRYNPRKRFDDARMQDLKESIKTVGLIQPLAVRRIDDNKYEVIAGIRRLKALKELYDEKKKIPCNVLNVSENEAKILSLTENIARDSLTPIEEARAYAEYVKVKVEIDGEKKEVTLRDAIEKNLPIGRFPSKDHKYIKELSEKIGQYSGAKTISNRLHLLALPEPVQTMIENKELQLQVAEELYKLYTSIRERSLREDYMLSLANEFRGDNPDMALLRKRIAKIIENYEKKTKIAEKRLKELEEVIKNRETRLLTELKNAIDIKEYVKKIDEEIEIDESEVLRYYMVCIEVFELDKAEFDRIEKADEKSKKIKEVIESRLTQVRLFGESEDERESLSDFVDKLVRAYNTRASQIITGKEYEELEEKEAELLYRRRRLEENLKEIIDKHLTRCPFCEAGVTAPDLKRRIQRIQDEIDGIAEERARISRIKGVYSNISKSIRQLEKDYSEAIASYEKLEKEVTGV